MWWEPGVHVAFRPGAGVLVGETDSTPGHTQTRSEREGSGLVRVWYPWWTGVCCVLPAKQLSDTRRRAVGESSGGADRLRP